MAGVLGVLLINSFDFHDVPIQSAVKTIISAVLKLVGKAEQLRMIVPYVCRPGIRIHL